jgi:cbb3-type cytochrome oxidase maturation protein
MGLEVLYLLIPASFALALAALGLFLWAIRAGQFDDLETPAIRMLAGEIPPEPVRPGASTAQEASGNKPESPL